MSRRATTTLGLSPPRAGFLGYLQDRTARRLRQLGFDETLFGIQIVVARFIDHANSPMPSGLYVRNSYVNLASLERYLVARIVETDYETP